MKAKTGSTFKMKKFYKMRLGTYKTKEKRDFMKRLFIDAQTTSEKSEYVVFK